MTCFSYFLRLLSRREYSTSELLQKGKEKGFEQSEITKSIDDLQSKGYQSDTRLVIQIISSSQSRYGKFVVRRKCLDKGIAADIFDQLWMEQQETPENEVTDELADLKAKVMRKYKIEDLQNIEPKIKAKVLNYLKYRGFNAFEVLQQWQKEEELNN